LIEHEDIKCENCKYAIDTPGGLMECYRLPDSRSIGGCGPLSSKDEWCAEFEMMDKSKPRGKEQIFD